MKTPTLAIGALALLALSACGGAAATAGPRPVPTTDRLDESPPPQGRNRDELPNQPALL